MKKIIEKLFSKLVMLIPSFPGGSYVLREIISAALETRRYVNHGNTKMLFTVGGGLCHYRVSTFASKEPDTLTWLEGMNSDDVLWDVGANIGLYSIYAAKKNQTKVFSFEPSVFNLELLARNVYYNDLDHLITVVPLALSDQVGASAFKLTSKEWGGALSNFGKDFDQHGDKLASTFEYQTVGITMDEAIFFFDLKPPSHLKIDVDGIEHLVLRGGKYTLSKVKSILVEIDDAFLEQAEESARHLRDAGMILLQKFRVGSTTQHNQLWARTRG